MFRVPSAMAEYQKLETYAWVLCFLCAAIAIALIVRCSKAQTEDEKMNEFLVFATLCGLIFAGVFLLLGSMNLNYLRSLL